MAETLGIADKLKALASILAGNSTIDDFTVINDDWDLQERLNKAFGRWGISHITPDMPMHDLSGGEKTKVFISQQRYYHL